jgi:signal transduction histidine kinase
MTASQQMIITLASISMYIVGLISLINGSHILYKLHKNWFFKFLVFYALLIIPFHFVSRDWSGRFLLFFVLVIVFEFLHLNLQAVRRHRPLGWILFTTAVLLILASICMVWLFVIGNIYLYWVVFSIVYVIPAIGLSLFTAGDFARTGLALQSRVAEVEQLSAKTISQEKEKQQILTAQNETLETQVSERTLDLKFSLEELKATQAQLIQSEKMASLGELTAGIAHEIQNPLNFVNNFSEVNKELLVEMKDEIDKGNFTGVKAIAKDVIENEEKISHHGKQADTIIKGMLEHSHRSSAKKEPTDINKLADEYLRLAFHGLRAKDKSFNATLKTDYVESIGNINIIPQDIGRVILNLITNAFYAVNEKKKQQPEGYEPTISVSTKKIDNKVEVKVGDNGNGIPQKVLDKIFQPFFTTKPTGQGTGLGLSLSYDIVKAHGGELKVETKEGEGAEFTIVMPV